MRIMNALSPSAYRSYPEMYHQLHCMNLALNLKNGVELAKFGNLDLWGLGELKQSDTMVFLGLKYGLCPSVAFGYVGCAVVAVMDDPELAYKLGAYT